MIVLVFLLCFFYGVQLLSFSHTFHQLEELHSLKAQELNGQVWRGWSKPSRRLKLGIQKTPSFLMDYIKPI